MTCAFMEATTTQRRVTSRRASSTSLDVHQAIAEVAQGIHQTDTKAVLLFLSSNYDADQASAAIRATFTCPVLACTTSGEIGPLGWTVSGMVGASLAGALDAAVFPLDHASSVAGVRSIAAAVDNRVQKFPFLNSACVIIHDGMSWTEEFLNAALQDAMLGTRLVGGSAGDDLRFGKTLVYANGELRNRHSAVLHLLSEGYLEPLKFQHFASGKELFVITSAHPDERRVNAIDGFPAAAEYARRLGLKPSELGPTVFSRWPLVVDIEGEDYVRSIRGIDDNGALLLYCSIEEGVLCSIGRPMDPIEIASKSFSRLAKRMDSLAAVLGFDCILRGLEAKTSGTADALAAVYEQYKVVGFHTYGETFGRLHVNQTFTGLAIGSSP